MLDDRITRDTRRRKGRSLVGVLLALAVATVAACSAAPDGGMPAQGQGTDLSFEKYTLGNGLEVILRKDDRVPVAAVNLWYHVGPANEVAGRTGFAHLFEHMMFQGSGHTEHDVYFPTLEALGASDVNATTGFDRTNYYETVPSNALERALWLESDRMGFLLDSLDQAQLANQQSVVRNERRQNTEAVPYGLSGEALYQALFPVGHPYHANIIGSHEDIQAARLDDVRSFFQQYYVPNNASLAIVGEIDVAATKAMVEKYFGSIPRGADVPKPQVDAPRLTSEQRLTITDDVELPLLQMAWVTPSVFTAGDAEADMTAGVLSGSRSSRLDELLVRRTRIAQSVSASQQSLSHGSVFSISAIPAPGHTVEELEAAIQRELDTLATDGPTAAELDAIETGFRAGEVFALESAGAVADTLNRYNHHTGDPGYLSRDLQRYAEVDPEAVKRFVVEQLPRDRRVVVHTVPGEKVLPPDPPAPATPDVAAAKVPSAQEWRNAVPELGPVPPLELPSAKRFELANGMPVYLLEAHHLPLTVARLVSRWGYATDPLDKPGLASISTDMLDEGTTSRDAFTIARETEAIGAALSASAGAESSAVQVSALTSRMDEAMAVMADVVREPTFPQAELDRIKERSAVALDQAGDDPSTVASGLAAGELYGGQHPFGRSIADVKRSLPTIGREDLLRHHRAAFTPSNSALILSGDLTEDQARALAEKHYGSWKGDGTEPRDIGPPVPSPERVFVVDKPGSPQSSVVLAQPGVAYADPDLAKLQVMNAVLGGGFSGRLNLNLRERNGYAYGASSSVGVGRSVGLITLTSSVQTAATGPSIKEMLAEVRAIRDAPITAAELQYAKDSLSLTEPTRFATVGSSASSIADLYLYDLPPDFYEGVPAAYADISIADVQAVAQAHLRPEELKVIVVGDRAQIDAQLAELSLGPIAYRAADGAPTLD
ncbi:M16 family metallopeptidase [Pseudonocardia sp. TRM90224]|uniref:M16 family metallopeptidase n=1 Tax=Pseudonocardia sp. TRM90224 TaxID=2812678 RepID=UPI001E545FD7|nr:pitrilysin family protein [Pseudonocardia sp. TRM90224]